MSCRKPVSTSLWASSELESPITQPTMPASNAAVTTSVRMLSGCCHHGSTTSPSPSPSPSMSSTAMTALSEPGASGKEVSEESEVKVTWSVCQRSAGTALCDRLLDLRRHRAAGDDLAEVGVGEPVANAVAVNAFWQALDDRVEHVLAGGTARRCLRHDRQALGAQIRTLVAACVDDLLGVVVLHAACAVVVVIAACRYEQHRRGEQGRDPAHLTSLQSRPLTSRKCGRPGRLYPLCCRREPCRAWRRSARTTPGGSPPRGSVAALRRRSTSPAGSWSPE